MLHAGTRWSTIRFVVETASLHPETALSSPRRLPSTAILLFFSGFCALIYQTVWMRQFRLLFGASTAATAATLAVFMGGLGLGGWLLGKRVEAHKDPLKLYGNIEIAVALLAVASPGLLWGAKWIYLATGGSQSLGLTGATVVRLMLATLVIGPATVLMGATMPAAARAVTSANDAARASVAVLLGVNTLGAVTGVLVSTFLLLEVLGAQHTLIIAALLNVLVGLTARHLAREPVAWESGGEAAVAVAPTAPAASPAFVVVAAAVVGFAFMVMELVWYRMLSPILGGSTYTFGLVLAVALLGIGLGGGAYAVWGRGRPATTLGLAWTCGLEALAMAVPYLLGDRVALLAAFLRPMSAFGFSALAAGWAVVASVVVLPAAIIAGYQFPLLIGLLGRGRAGVGRQVGIAYASNTGGSIIGSIAGGFGLVPMLSALGAWKMVVIAMGAESLWALSLSVRVPRRGRLFSTVSAAATVTLAVACLIQQGPTSAWRHSAIGAGRATASTRTSINALKEWVNAWNRSNLWEQDGVESSVALYGQVGLAFVVNGKIDGNALSDAGTQIMGGLVGAALAPDPHSAFVIGLGTGTTAGWLASVPSIERVDVAEIEPAMLHVAQACAAVNAAALENPKVSVHLDDARELLLTSKRQYDVVFSEPSNPYRAGIASLYTHEFYAAVRARLSRDGIFLQWLQAYETDAATVRSVLVTLASVFSNVEVWATQATDLLLVARTRASPIDADALRARLAQPPYDKAIRAAWSTDSLEGFLAHHLAGRRLAAGLAKAYPSEQNRDDTNQVEFAFARTVGLATSEPITQLIELSRKIGSDRPEVAKGEVDWDLWNEEVMLFTRLGRVNGPAELRRRVDIALQGPEGAAAFKAQPFEPRTLTEILAVAQALAATGDERALEIISRLQESHPAEVLTIRATLRQKQNRLDEAAADAVAALWISRTQVWVSLRAGLPALISELAPRLEGHAEASRALFDALATPLAAYFMEDKRQFVRLGLARQIDSEHLCGPAFEGFEPHPLWEAWFLQARAACYARIASPRAASAAADLEAFLSRESQPLVPPEVFGDATAPRSAEVPPQQAAKVGAPNR
jgi:spermidine synthase